MPKSTHNNAGTPGSSISTSSSKHKIKKKSHKKKVKTKISLASMLGGRAMPLRRSTRTSRLPTRLSVSATEEELVEEDEDIDILTVPDGSDDDGDWIQNVPNRPGPFRNTWLNAYAQRTVYGVLYRVPCGEGCGGTVYLSSSLKEVRSDGSPLPGAPRKPPVCHIVSWAALQYQMIQMEGAQSRLLNKPCLLRDDFRKAVCWEQSNVGPGHSACNSAGVKTTAQNVGSAELREALLVIDRVTKAFGGPIWG